MSWQTKLTWTALAPSLAALILASMAALVFSGRDALLGAFLGSAIVLIFCLSGQLVSRFSLSRENLGQGMFITMTALALRLAFVGASLWAIGKYLQVEPIWLAIGALATLISWLTGLVIGNTKARVPVYDTPYQVNSDSVEKTPKIRSERNG